MLARVAAYGIGTFNALPPSGAFAALAEEPVVVDEALPEVDFTARSLGNEGLGIEVEDLEGLFCCRTG